MKLLILSVLVYGTLASNFYGGNGQGYNQGYGNNHNQGYGNNNNQGYGNNHNQVYGNNPNQGYGNNNNQGYGNNHNQVYGNNPNQGYGNNNNQGYGNNNNQGLAHGNGYSVVGKGGIYQKASYGNTEFSYNDGLSTREEHIATDGSKVGSYSVQGADGKLRTVKYRAGKDGFQILGDDASVREDNVARAAGVAAKAAELAKAAPRAPVAASNTYQVPNYTPTNHVAAQYGPQVPNYTPTNHVAAQYSPQVPHSGLPVAPTNPPDYGRRNELVYESRKAGNTNGNTNSGYDNYGNSKYGAGLGHAAPAPVSGYGYNAPQNPGYYY